MRLGELLVNAGKITPTQLEETLKGQAIFGGRFGTNLVEMGYLDEQELAHFLSQKTGIAHTSPGQLIDIPPHVVGAVPEEYVRKHRVIPVALNNRKLTLAMLDPSDFHAIDEIAFATGYIVVPVIAPELRLLSAMEKYYGIKRELRYISVEGLSRNRAQNATPAAQPKTAKAAAPPPPPEDDPWLSAEDAQILELPLLDELECFGDLSIEPTLDPLAGSSLYQNAPEKDYSLDGVLTGLAHAEDRDQIADLIVGHLAQRFPRVAFFLLRGGKATGWLAQVDQKPVPDFEAVEIPPTEPSVLQVVDETKSFYVGPLPATAGNLRLLKALGGGNPPHNLMVPLTMMGRVVAVLYIGGGSTSLEVELPQLQKLMAKAAMAFEILILKSKILMT
ncbi:general secretory system protein E [Geoanaerobacter pelophilus]|uniref:General secretory system protein E n=1 Tax=Geoanaerobacter pelophilus TaxID=60036 RepID=A0ABQ0MM30_9BACT|nr:general secretion pathway protein [Geoanaerobacter pelophilus]GAW68145.1 general secretory system protein E [Geoanaerobacter pelophilus]